MAAVVLQQQPLSILIQIFLYQSYIQNENNNWYYGHAMAGTVPGAIAAQ